MEKIDYKEIIKKFPWIVEENYNCILSPDSDGILSGLLMSHFLNWKIKGYYDGKVLVVDKNTLISDCIFLDMEIFRKGIKSIGHHMVLFNKNKEYKLWNNFAECIQPNNLRNYDAYTNFQLKYPLATIHLLIGILGSQKKIEIKDSAICPLLYTDGVFKNLFGYPENCVDWLLYLDAERVDGALHKIFHNDYYSIHNLMIALKNFFGLIAKIGENKRGNDKIKISNSNGEPINLIKRGDCFDFSDEEKEKAEKFLKILSDLTGWKYDNKNWQWSDLKLKIFKKGNVRPNNRNFEELISKKPLSWAMTSGLSIEYTLDPKNILLE
jgi:hypothetical protein